MTTEFIQQSRHSSPHGKDQSGIQQPGVIESPANWHNQAEPCFSVSDIQCVRSEGNSYGPSEGPTHVSKVARRFRSVMGELRIHQAEPEPVRGLRLTNCRGDKCDAAYRRDVVPGTKLCQEYCCEPD
jgi:hypothetical protein